MTGFAALQQLARRPAAKERCDLCGSAIAEQHDHLLETEKRRLVCACRPCTILFGDSGQRYRRVPTRILALGNFHLSGSQWESLMVPINMAFFYRGGAEGKVTAVYPSPAGATESHLELETWQRIEKENPVLLSMEPDVEALVVNRLGEQHGFGENQYFLAPIDQCFRLVGLVRKHWRGLSGGSDLWEHLREYFAELEGAQHA
ncbi:MAG TPA: DUF5947 family protein [Bryobacteraceae bacterium]|nr:DUF5947 family protein [Bryobacteraceae bacterium]